MNYVHLLQLLGYEHLWTRPFQRQPESDLVMIGENQVEAFDAAGDVGGLLEGIYLWNVLGLSRRIPYGGHLVDLGCGPGSYIKFFKTYRPDVTVTGIDLSEPMLARARQKFSDADGIQFVQGDITIFPTLIDRPIDAVSCIFTVHHLDSYASMVGLLDQFNRFLRHSKGRLWVFDHARPRHIKAAHIFPKAFMIGEPDVICRDSTNSLLASFTLDELSAHFSSDVLVHKRSSIIPYYQVHASPALERPVPLIIENPDLEAFCRIMGDIV